MAGFSSLANGAVSAKDPLSCLLRVAPGYYWLDRNGEAVPVRVSDFVIPKSLACSVAFLHEGEGTEKLVPIFLNKKNQVTWIGDLASILTSSDHEELFLKCLERLGSAPGILPWLRIQKLMEYGQDFDSAVKKTIDERNAALMLAAAESSGMV